MSYEVQAALYFIGAAILFALAVGPPLYLAFAR